MALNHNSPSKLQIKAGFSQTCCLKKNDSIYHRTDAWFDESLSDLWEMHLLFHPRSKIMLIYNYDSIYLT